MMFWDRYRWHVIIVVAVIFFVSIELAYGHNKTTRVAGVKVKVPHSHELANITSAGSSASELTNNVQNGNGGSGSNVLNLGIAGVGSRKCAPDSPRGITGCQQLGNGNRNINGAPAP